MSNIRPLLRSPATDALVRPSRPRQLRAPVRRRLKSTSPAYDENARSFHPAAVGGVAGAVTTLAGCYLWYRFSGAKSVVGASHETKKYLDSVQHKFHQTQPDPDQTLKWLRQLASSYASFIPGASRVVNGAFDELDRVHASHRGQVDVIISECYEELRQVSKDGLDVQSATKGWGIVIKHLRRVHDLASNALTESLDRHPHVKAQLGANIDELHRTADKLGPEARQILEQTWRKASEIVKNGDDTLDQATITRVQQVIDDAIQRMRAVGDQSWQEAMRQARPFLDKHPDVKKLVEQHASSLRQYDVRELADKMQRAATSGDPSELRDHVRDVARRTQTAGARSLQDMLDNVPDGNRILPELSRVHEAARKHGGEAEQLLRSTVAELSQVLARKAEEARRIAERAERDAGGASADRRDSSSSASSSWSWFGKG